MKIQGNDADFIRAEISRVMTENPNAADSYRSQGLTHKRYRWDLFWCANSKNREAFNTVIDSIYSYANDIHLDTLLRSIVGSDWE